MDQIFNATQHSKKLTIPTIQLQIIGINTLSKIIIITIIHNRLEKTTKD